MSGGDGKKRERGYAAEEKKKEKKYKQKNKKAK